MLVVFLMLVWDLESLLREVLIRDKVLGLIWDFWKLGIVMIMLRRFRVMFVILLLLWFLLDVVVEFVNILLIRLRMV